LGGHDEQAGRCHAGCAFPARLDLSALLALVTINYMDRSALGVVAQAVLSEFKLSPVQMG
jgi:hypothetical protein